MADSSDAPAPSGNTVKTLESADEVQNAISASKPSVILINTPGTFLRARVTPLEHRLNVGH